MTVDEAIKARRSIRRYQEKPVPESDVNHLLDLARCSPSSMNELGGTSLKAAQLLARIQRAYDMDVSMQSFFENPTVAGLAQAVVHKKAEGTNQGDVIRFLHELTGS